MYSIYVGLNVTKALVDFDPSKPRNIGLLKFLGSSHIFYIKVVESTKYICILQ